MKATSLGLGDKKRKKHKYLIVLKRASNTDFYRRGNSSATDRRRPKVRAKHDRARRWSIRNDIVVFLDMVDRCAETISRVGGERGVDTGVEILSSEHTQVALWVCMHRHGCEDVAGRHCEDVDAQFGRETTSERVNAW